MLQVNRIIWVALFAAVLLLAACSPSAEKLNGEGNQAFVEQAYQDALAAYQGAQIENPELAEPYYNAANALYRQGNYEGALEQLQHALNFVEDDQLFKDSLYNVGNNFFNAQDLQSAVDAYKQALLIDPGDQDAKYNLELALQQQEQQEQQRQQQGQEQNQEDQQNQDGSDSEDSSEKQDEDSRNNDSSTEQQEQSQDQSRNQAGEIDEQDGRQDNVPQPGDDDQNQEENPDAENNQPTQPVERMTEEQAKQMLAAIANDMETLQEKLGKILFVRSLPPLQDW
jgi:Ca-activated chloride channel family protein